MEAGARSRCIRDCVKSLVDPVCYLSLLSWHFCLTGTPTKLVPKNSDELDTDDFDTAFLFSLLCPSLSLKVLMATRGLLQCTSNMTPRLLAKSSLQHISPSPAVMRSTLGRRLVSSSSAASGGASGSGPFRSSSKMAMTAAALLGTATYVVATGDAEPLQASTAATLDLDPNDPLSALYPHILHASTSHLDDLSLATLIKTYIVYLGSSQSALVEAGPWMLHKLEWARDNVPIVGTVAWSIFATVSTSSDVAHLASADDFPLFAPRTDDEEHFLFGICRRSHRTRLRTTC